MDARMNALFHFSIPFILSIGVFPFRRFSMIIALFIIPLLGEIFQVFIPGRTPDFIDVLHGYLGILAGYSLVQLYREIQPVVKRAQPYFLRRPFAPAIEHNVYPPGKDA